MVEVTVKGARRRRLVGRLVEVRTRSMARQVGSGVSALVVARPGAWRDALQAMLVEIPRIETIHLAIDAASALRAAAALCPDLVVLDTDQPDGWDWTVAHKLKRACPHARSLVLTAELPDTENLGSITADAMLVKGCSAAVLFQVLESLLPQGMRDAQPADFKPQQNEEVMRPNPS